MQKPLKTTKKTRKTVPVKVAKAARVTKAVCPKGADTGEINIVGLFEAEAAALLQSVKRGLILHKTHNIRDSGALLESTFRQIIGSRLPSQAQMAHGYLYDLESNCTPQIDAMVLSAEHNYPMMKAEGEAIYAPFTSCRAYVEIKSSSKEVTKQLSQSASISMHISKMAASMSATSAGTASTEKIGSVLLYANSNGAKAAPFNKRFSTHLNVPTLVVFLDKAVVISRRPPLNKFMERTNDDSEHAETLDLSGPFAGDEAWLYKPKAKTLSEARGLVLLWLYYWLLYCATQNEVKRAEANKKQAELLNSTLAASDAMFSTQSHQYQVPPVTAFITAANRRFPLVAVKSLADFNGLIPSFESC